MMCGHGTVGLQHAVMASTTPTAIACRLHDDRNSLEPRSEVSGVHSAHDPAPLFAT